MDKIFEKWKILGFLSFSVLSFSEIFSILKNAQNSSKTTTGQPNLLLVDPSKHSNPLSLKRLTENA